MPGGDESQEANGDPELDGMLAELAALPGAEFSWSDLPADCPPPEAQGWNGVFYRMVDGSADDWRSLFDINGEAWCAGRLSGTATMCRWNALSIFDSFDAIADRLSLDRFNGHKAVKFTVNPEMGVVAQTGGKHHHSWWPHLSDFVPPPDDLEDAP